MSRAVVVLYGTVRSSSGSVVLIRVSLRPRAVAVALTLRVASRRRSASAEELSDRVIIRSTASRTLSTAPTGVYQPSGPVSSSPISTVV